MTSLAYSSIVISSSIMTSLATVTRKINCIDADDPHCDMRKYGFSTKDVPSYYSSCHFCLLRTEDFQKFNKHIIHLLSNHIIASGESYTIYIIYACTHIIIYIYVRI